ncbi:MAG: DUF2250 domain-containing protein [candidate division Zixibacteria bacterium]
MADQLNLKPDFTLAKCCSPSQDEAITGFLKPDSGIISIHVVGCENLNSIQPERLVKLEWDEILSDQTESNLLDDPAYQSLDGTDLAILRHHAKMGVDYAAVVAKHTGIDRATVFERHKKLRDLKLLARVQPTMIQYRKGFTKNKWIKHRNHTYYELTELGRGMAESYY